MKRSGSAENHEYPGAVAYTPVIITPASGGGLLPSVSLRSFTARARPDFIETGHCGLIQLHIDSTKDGVQLVQCSGPDDRGRHAGLMKQPYTDARRAALSVGCIRASCCSSCSSCSSSSSLSPPSPPPLKICFVGGTRLDT